MPKKVECSDESADFNEKAIKGSKKTSNSSSVSVDYSIKSKKLSTKDEAC